jgi:hypothetical protein
MGVISEADKKILLERLAKAREAKAAKKKATSAAADVAATSAAAQPSVAVPDVAPPSVAAPVELSPPVPDLVAAAATLSAKKPKQKKVKLPESSSDSDSDDEPKKKNKSTKRSGAPYMKIKIYKDSPHALEHILHTIQDNQEEEQAPEKHVAPHDPSEPIPISARRTVCMTGSRPSSNTQALRTGSLRDAALAFFS